MKKIWDSFINIVLGIIMILIIGIIGFVIGWHTCKSQTEEKTVSDNSNTSDWKLPGETEKETVTVLDVKSILKEISELSTYEGVYTVTYGKDNTRHIFEDVTIPGTTNNVTLTCNGIVKVGYDLKDIDVEIDKKTICISLPEKAKVNDNYIIWDTVTYNEKNNILNPIEFSQYESLIDDIEEMGLEQVESKGIYDDAEENFKKVIEGFLSKFEDYKIEYK